MPTYQYACTAPECGHRFDVVAGFSDPPASACPRCSGAVRKVYGAVGVVFKGSGFYRNDSRESARRDRAKDSGSKKEPAGAESGKSAASESGTGTGTGTGAGTGTDTGTSSAKADAPAH